jgi:hypothetical protein
MDEHDLLKFEVVTYANKLDEDGFTTFNDNLWRYETDEVEGIPCFKNPGYLLLMPQPILIQSFLLTNRIKELEEFEPPPSVTKYYESDTDPSVDRIDLVPCINFNDFEAAKKVYHTIFMENLNLKSLTTEVRVTKSTLSMSELSGYTLEFFKIDDLLRNSNNYRIGLLKNRNFRVLCNSDVTKLYNISNFLHEPNYDLLIVCKKSKWKYQDELLFEIMKNELNLIDLINGPKVRLKPHTPYQEIVKYPDKFSIRIV